MSKPFRFCPHCGRLLEMLEQGGAPRPSCLDPACGFVHWDNPTPVVAAVVEHEGKIVLAHNKAWPADWYALITGFLEKNEEPAAAVLREVKEELDLDGEAAHFIGHYEFQRMNQIIIAYHVRAHGIIRLNDELDAWRHVAFGDVTYWPAGTGFALRDWLRTKGFDPQLADFMRPAA